jgi:hypothetical protein
MKIVETAELAPTCHAGCKLVETAEIVPTCHNFSLAETTEVSPTCHWNVRSFAPVAGSVVPYP